MEVVACQDAADLARRAGALLIDRLRAKPDLAVAVPAGRTPRVLYTHLATVHARDPSPFARIRVFAVDELCPPAPTDGYFWRQIRREFLDWARVPAAQLYPFRVDEPDLASMCRRYEAAIQAVGGLDLVMLGLGPNGHLASNEPGSAFDSPTRPVELLASTVDYILTDEVIQGAVSSRAVTLGLRTILEAREVVVLVEGVHKRAPLRAMVEGPVTNELPASVLQRHPRCTVLAGRTSLEGLEKRAFVG
ncbi:MAG TPA: 6-phosphogluconolactonase [Methylomirabilota bacterium]|jgi:glucosamine-6-phosphate deaminase|nr:6-phosphogluconolactonase [Methylomirabilota bacterium]